LRSDRSNRAAAQRRSAGAPRILRRRALALVPVAAIAAVAIVPSAFAAATKTHGTLVNGSLPPVGTPAKGGDITVGQSTGQTPTDIFPMVPAATCSTATFQLVNSLYQPLYSGPAGARPTVNYAESVADAPVYSDNDKTVTIKIKPGQKWSDGKPVDAADVIFFLDLLKAGLKESAANWCQYAPGTLPDNVKSWSTKGADTVVLHLTHSVNPNWFTLNNLQDTAAGVFPLPAQDWNIAATGGKHLDYTKPANAKAIFNYLNKQGSSIATFASNPLWKVVDGPFSLKDFSATNSSYDMVPNPSYSQKDKPKESEVSFQTFTSSTAELNALESGSLDIGNLDAGTQLGAIPRLKDDGYSVFGSPSWGWFGGIINFKDTTDHFNKLIVQPYIKAALAELVDQSAILSGVYHGYAVPAYSPVPLAPSSPFVPNSVVKPAYPYSPKKAVATLKAHGWKVVPGGQTVCAKAGTAKDECGAGIPAGTPFKFVWANVPESVASTGVLESEVFSSEAKKAAGINIDLVTKTFNFLISNYSDANPAAAKYTNDWAVNNFGGISTDYYPTQYGTETPGGSLNDGDYNDPTANKLMKASVTSNSSKAIVKEVKYFGKNYPVFYMPVQDWIMAISKNVGGPTDSFLEMSYQVYPMQDFYTVK
jgi:peptide/nickel transport system substrate-binding protein